MVVGMAVDLIAMTVLRVSLDAIAVIETAILTILVDDDVSAIGIGTAIPGGAARGKHQTAGTQKAGAGKTTTAPVFCSCFVDS
jgi:hypothetical protein